MLSAHDLDKLIQILSYPTCVYRQILEEAIKGNRKLEIKEHMEIVLKDLKDLGYKVTPKEDYKYLIEW